MALSIDNRPSNFTSAYVPVEYTLTSTFAGRLGTVASASSFNGGASTSIVIVLSTFPSASTSLKKDGVISISNSTFYDGDHKVLVSGGSGILIIDTPFLGNDSGSFEYTRLNAHVLCDLYIDGSFVVRKKRFVSANYDFVFDFDREVQVELGNDQKPMAIGGSVTAINPEASTSIYIIATEYEDIITNGIAVTTPNTNDIENDSANARTIINSTVPYLEWTLGSVRSDIANKSTDLTDFIMTSSSSARFLTNSPKTITIGSSEAYEIAIIVDYNPAVTYELNLDFFNAAGTQLSSVSIPYTASSDSVWRFDIGTRGAVGAVMPPPSVNPAYYTITAVDAANGDLAISEVMRFNLDNACHGSSTRFSWLNPRGGYDAYTFHSPRKLNSQVSKSTYKPARVYPVVVGNAEEAVTNVNARDSLTTATNKVNKEVAEWMQELLESPQVFIELESSNALHDKRIPVIIVNKTRAIVNSYSGSFNVSLRYKFAFEKIGIRAN